MIYWFRWWKEQRTRRRIVQKAFADGRFVMFMNLRNYITAVCFTPTLDEAEMFLWTYAFRWAYQDIGLFDRYFSRTGPWPGDNRIETWHLFSDIQSIVLMTRNEEDRERLDKAALACLERYNALLAKSRSVLREV